MTTLLMPREREEDTGSREVTGSGSSSRVLPYTNIKFGNDDIADDKGVRRGPLIAKR
jgi:hypothetical protein